jgi:hypothetical protein
MLFSYPSRLLCLMQVRCKAEKSELVIAHRMRSRTRDQINPPCSDVAARGKRPTRTPQRRRAHLRGGDHHGHHGRNRAHHRVRGHDPRHGIPRVRDSHHARRRVRRVRGSRPRDLRGRGGGGLLGSRRPREQRGRTRRLRLAPGGRRPRIVCWLAQQGWRPGRSRSRRGRGGRSPTPGTRRGWWWCCSRYPTGSRRRHWRRCRQRRLRC